MRSCCTTDVLDINLSQVARRPEKNANRRSQCLQVETFTIDFRCVPQEYKFTVIHLRTNTLYNYNTEGVHAWWWVIPWRQWLGGMAFKVGYQLITNSLERSHSLKVNSVLGCVNRKLSNRSRKDVLLQGLKASSNTVSEITVSKMEDSC